MLEIGNPWGLFAFLSVPAVLFFHFFRTRFSRHVVPAVFLWDQDRERSPEGSTFERLQNTASLILEILAAVILSLLLSGLSCSAARSFSHTIIILDDSLSMKAEADGKSFYERARDACISLCSDERDTLYTVITAGTDPRILAGPFSPASYITAAVHDWIPASYTSNLARALDFTTQFREAASAPVYVTDHVPENCPEHVRIVSIGKPVQNAGIAAARRLHTLDGDETVFTVVRNFSETKFTATVSVQSGKSTITEKQLTLSPAEDARFSFSVPKGTGPVTVLLGKDGFGEDNSVRLLPGLRKKVKIFSGLEKDPGIARLVSIIPDVDPAGSSAESNIAFVPQGSNAHETEHRWVIRIGPEQGKQVNISDGFLLDRTSPFLRGITLKGVIWGGIGPVSRNVEPLISAGPHFLFFRDVKNGVFCINIDPAKTNFFRSVDWPVLFSNLTEQMRSLLPGFERSNYILGEDVVYYTPQQLRGLECTVKRNGTELYTAVLSDMHLVRKTGKQGLYTLNANGTPAGRFAVNFINPLESDFQKAAEEDTGTSERTKTVTRKQRQAWLTPLMILAVLIFLAIDWIMLRIKG